MSTVPHRDDPMWGPVPLPDWVEGIRPHQWDAVQEVIEELHKGTDLVFLEAPTGSGKSLIAELVRRLLHTRATYSCTTKALQDQLELTLPYAKVIKGRANYLTMQGVVDEWGSSKVGVSDITCADCTWNGQTETCRWCYERVGCPYQQAKSSALEAQLAIVNTSYLLTTSRAGGFNTFHTRGLCVIDEADMLESELLGHAELVVTKHRMDSLGIPYPTHKTVLDSWVTWAQGAFDIVEQYRKGLPKPWQGNPSLRAIRHYNGVTDLYTGLGALKDELPNGGWVYDGYEARKDQGSGPVIFRPVRVDRWGHQLLWSGTRQALLMSATILSDSWMAEDIGLAKSYKLVKVPSTFPVANRPIHVVDVANMRYEDRDTSWPEMVEGVAAVLDRHPDDRILVHTVSYDLARYLKDGLKSGQRFGRRPIYIYTNSGEKADALRGYKRDKGSVLLAASMDRGVDLPDDMCRVQVVAKIPYPNIKDRRIKARMRSQGGSTWYKMQTIRSLVQMTGRGVRSETDHAITYILDDQFAQNLWSNGRWLFPSWWAEALQFNIRKRHLVGK